MSIEAPGKTCCLIKEEHEPRSDFKAEPPEKVMVLSTCKIAMLSISMYYVRDVSRKDDEGLEDNISKRIKKFTGMDFN